jgi:hypothetical protein
MVGLCPKERDSKAKLFDFSGQKRAAAISLGRGIGKAGSSKCRIRTTKILCRESDTLP